MEITIETNKVQKGDKFLATTGEVLTLARSGYSVDVYSNTGEHLHGKFFDELVFTGEYVNAVKAFYQHLENND